MRPSSVINLETCHVAVIKYTQDITTSKPKFHQPNQTAAETQGTQRSPQHCLFTFPLQVPSALAFSIRTVVCEHSGNVGLWPWESGVCSRTAESKLRWLTLGLFTGLLCPGKTSQMLLACRLAYYGVSVGNFSFPLWRHPVSCCIKPEVLCLKYYCSLLVSQQYVIIWTWKSESAFMAKYPIQGIWLQC